MITSLDNKTVKELTKLHQKKYRDDKFLLLDEHLIKCAKENNYLETLVYCDKLPFEFRIGKVSEIKLEIQNLVTLSPMKLEISGIDVQLKTVYLSENNFQSRLASIPLISNFIERERKPNIFLKISFFIFSSNLWEVNELLSFF